MKTQMSLIGFPLWQRRRRMFEIRPYFFPLECACMSEGTNAFAYETG
jgi:hypothetical protein